jgi:hypothetical protein
MNLNPYEAPAAAHPPIAASKNRFYELCGPFEMLNAIGFAIFFLASVGYRLNWQFRWFPQELLDSHASYFLFSGLALIAFAGVRGLFFVFCRKQSRAVTNGTLCVLGFIVFVVSIAFVMEK